MIDLHLGDPNLPKVKPVDTPGCVGFAKRFRDLRNVSLFLHGAESVGLDISRVQNEHGMLGVSLPRAAISVTFVLLCILVISGHYPSGTRYQQTQGETMASALKSVTVPAKGPHTATVIFMHVRRHRVQSAPTPDP